MKIPKSFSLKKNAKRALGNGVGLALFMSLILGITNPWLLIGGFLFGLLGGSINDIIGWKGNREAIESHNKQKSKKGDNNDN